MCPGHYSNTKWSSPLPKNSSTSLFCDQTPIDSPALSWAPTFPCSHTWGHLGHWVIEEHFLQSSGALELFSPRGPMVLSSCPALPFTPFQWSGYSSLGLVRNNPRALHRRLHSLETGKHKLYYCVCFGATTRRGGVGNEEHLVGAWGLCLLVNIFRALCSI